VKLLYKPVGLLLGIAGGLAARASFRRLWRLVSDKDDAPQATDRERSWREVVAGAAMQGAVFAAVKAIVDRAGAAGFARLTGVWPGDDAKDEPSKKK
jgi:hypothetical protein